MYFIYYQPLVASEKFSPPGLWALKKFKINHSHIRIILHIRFHVAFNFIRRTTFIALTGLSCKSFVRCRLNKLSIMWPDPVVPLGEMTSGFRASRMVDLRASARHKNKTMADFFWIAQTGLEMTPLSWFYLHVICVFIWNAQCDRLCCNVRPKLRSYRSLGSHAAAQKWRMCFTVPLKTEDIHSEISREFRQFFAIR